MKDLNQRKLASRHEYLQLEQSHIELEYDIGTLKAQIKETKAAITTARQQKDVFTAQFKRTSLEHLNEINRNRDALIEELAEANIRHRFPARCSSWPCIP